MTTEAKTYNVEVTGGGDCDVSPSRAVFSISKEKAERIIALSKMAKEHDLYCIKFFDAEVRFLQFDPETQMDDANGVGNENDVRTECDSIEIRNDDFIYTAYIKHTDLMVRSESQPISELAEHFGLH